MIGKVVGYAGFQSYGDLPFSTLKPGKDQQKDAIWEETARQQDKKPHLQNYHHMKSTYHKDYLENTMPQNYNVTLVQRGSKGFASFSGSNNIRTHQKLESSAINRLQDRTQGSKAQMLRTGVEHWKSNYQKCNDNVTRSKNSALARSAVNGFSNSRTYNAEVAPPSSSNIESDIQNRDVLQPGYSRSSIRSASVNKGNEFKPPVPAWSKNVSAYSNKTPTGVTDYKFNYGEKIGHEPKPHIMDQFSTCQPRMYNPLKAGTTQLVEHIPGYQGFLPAAKTFGRPFQQSKGSHTRTTFLKSNLIDDYQVNIPGYSGFKTKQNFIADDKLRSSCFRSNQFLKN